MTKDYLKLLNTLDLIQSILKMQKKSKKKYPMKGANISFIIRYENTTWV